MSDPKDFTKYDSVLSSILVEEGSILGFLSSIFNFLGRRTDFYYIQKDPQEKMGFPEGMAEQLVLKVLRSCDPKRWPSPVCRPDLQEMNNDIMCSTVAQEVEVVAEEEEVVTEECELTDKKEEQIKKEYKPPVIPTQLNSESYNGAVRDKYTWSQTIMELDLTIKLPPDIKSAKDLKVVINSGDISVMKRNGEVIIKDTFPYKIKGLESMWSVSEGKLLIHLEKAQERWWTKLLSQEEELDLSKLDCSRPLDELPEDHVAKIRELQWNEERKQRGLPTSDEMRKIEILKKAWNAEGSPFKGKEFDPNVLMK